jgi:heme oxygenase
MPEAAEIRLPDLLRTRTHALHRRAERTGIIAELLRGRGDRHGYALLLRNLLPAYRELERGLDLQRASPGLASIADPAVYRAAALESDLRALHGSGWEESLPVLPSGERYARRVVQAAGRGAAGLLGHAYARYLGDLNGGRMLGRLLARSLHLGPAALAFCAYPDIPDVEGFKHAYREAFGEAAGFVDVDVVVEEALAAFALNIDVSEEVQRAAAARPAR